MMRNSRVKVFHSLLSANSSFYVYVKCVRMHWKGVFNNIRKVQQAVEPFNQPFMIIHLIERFFLY